MATKQKSPSQWPEWMQPGVRVVRGPDWRTTIRKIGEVELGTLSYVPKLAADNKVNVVWDNGLERNYKSGYTGEYQLRAYDLQQVGIVHKKVTCSDCNANPLRGIRFYCVACKLNLCTACYMADKHSTSHTFSRYDTPSSSPVNLPARNRSSNQMLVGIFEDSEVIRGPHWSYADKDGGDGQRGTVMNFLPLKDDCANGWVTVKWDIGKVIAECRLGAGGYVDVVAFSMACGGNIYSEHLPVVGIIKLKLGDKVAVNLAVAEFKAAQTKGKVPGGWKDGMQQCTTETGTIMELLFDGEMARVQYQNGNIHIVVRSALYRVGGFFTGGVVRVTNSTASLKLLQEGHGGYSDDYNKAKGHIGRILSIHPDGDMRILVGGQKYNLSPACCDPVEDPAEQKKAPAMPDSDDDSMGGGSGTDKDKNSMGGSIDKQIVNAFSEGMASAFRSMMRQDSVEPGHAMFEAFAQRDFDQVQQLVLEDGDLVDYKLEGKTILHLACHEGYTDLVEFLINQGADMVEPDAEGDTPMHYAAFGKQPDCIQILLETATNPNIQNNNGVTPLIIAINLPCLDSVQFLAININCNVSLKTSDGDTAMHDCVKQTEGQPLITNAVLGKDNVDYTVLNGHGFNVLHWAILQDNRAAVSIILSRSPHLVGVPVVAGGYSPLHIAALNNFVEILSRLLEQGKARPDARDDDGKTPLHLAVAQGHKHSIEVLLDKGADITAQDNLGDTALHLALSPIPLSASISQRSRRSMAAQNDTNIHNVYFLLEKGAALDIKNKKGLTSLDLVEDPHQKEMYRRMTVLYQKSPVETQRGVRLPIHWQKMVEMTGVVHVQLDTSDKSHQQEYGEIAKQFQKSYPKARFHSVKRVQNPLLWEHYTLKKREMETKYGQGCGKEMYLYHGTRPELVDIIAKDNFDFRIAGSRIGALYGDGAYFASTAKYSDMYANANDRGNKTMFVAKVLVGKHCQGVSKLKRPPDVDNKDYAKGQYDCTVNDVNNPTIFCVFDKNQYYPEYIVEYK